MTIGIIYLVQPSELIGTKRFKIGYSKEPTLDRCKNGYKNGTRYLCIMECKFPNILEKKIKDKFKKKFKLFSGCEFFEGNEKQIIDEFIIIVNEHMNDNLNNDIHHNIYNGFNDSVDNVCVNDVKFDDIKFCEFNEEINKSKICVKVMLNDVFRNNLIYESKELNDKMFNSFYGDNEIIEAIDYSNYGKISIVNKLWYNFNGHIWKLCDNVTTDILIKFANLYDKMIQFINNSTKLLNLEKLEYVHIITEKKKYITYVKKNRLILLLSKKVKTYQSFDENKNLIAFNNGVYDFSLDIFRKGMHSDMISKVCNYNYNNQYVDKQILINMLLNIFQNTEIMECFLTYLAMSLCGKYDNNLLMLLQQIANDTRNCQKLTNLIIATFNSHCLDINNYEYILKLSINELKTLRLLIMTKMEKITQKEIFELINSKKIQTKKSGKIDVNFSTLCICTQEPEIENNILENIGKIILPTIKYDETEIVIGDFFLLLIEYLKKNKSNNILNKLKFVKPDNRTLDEKLIDEFINENIIISTAKEIGLYKCKSNDIYERYIQWTNNKENNRTLSRIAFNTLMKKKNLIYNRSVRFNDTSTACFFDLRLK